MSEKIVLGLGNNVDYEIVWDRAIFERLAGDYRITSSDLSNTTPIMSVRDLLASILDFMHRQSAGERFVVSPELIIEFSQLFNYRVTLGGTAVRAALAMRKLGHIPALHLVTLNKDIRAMLPKDCPWVCSNDRESVYPHLIVQFPDNAQINTPDISVQSRSANRIIYVHDPDGAGLRISPNLAALAADAQVLLLSGFNAVRSPTVLNRRLEDVHNVLRSLSQETIVFYEDACFHDSELSVQVRNFVRERVHIYSLNEDELQGHLRRQVDLANPVDVLAAVREFALLVPVPTLILHTRNWALAYGTRAHEYAGALRSAIVMASTRMRLGDDFVQSDYLDTKRICAESTHAAFADAIGTLAAGRVCCVPSLKIAADEVNRKPLTTVGLGDAFVGGFLPHCMRA